MNDNHPGEDRFAILAPVVRPGRDQTLRAKGQRLRRFLAPILIAGALTGLALLATCSVALAAGSGMPWEAPMQRILESIEGPVAKIVAVIIIIITGLSLAFGDISGAFRRMVQVVFGLSIAFAATSFFLSFFSFAGGALIE